MEIELDSGSDIRADAPLQWKTSTSKSIWYKWLKYRIRQCMILEVIFLIILLLLLHNSYKTTSQNETILELISHLQTRIDKLEKMQSFSNVPTNTSDEEMMKSTGSSEESTTKVIEEIKTTTVPTSTEAPVRISPDAMELYKPPEPFNRSLPHFNAASYLSGARVSQNLSSHQRSYLDQSHYVILEREPVRNKAWCTDREDPVLTIALAENIRPVAVSYQHLRWNRIVPSGAPRAYDVKACLDVNCTIIIPLASNCEYKSLGEQEQFCSIDYKDDKLPLIKRIQFHFHKNHGNVKVTCAYLVRVFGEGNRKMGKITPPEGHREKCSSLIWHRKNYPFIYNYILVKNCKRLYENDCCAECPECCTECLISDWNYIEILKIIGITFFIGFWVIFICIGINAKKLERRR